MATTAAIYSHAIRGKDRAAAQVWDELMKQSRAEKSHGRKLGIVMERQPDPDHELQVARYLSAAYVAYVHGQGMDYTRKKYADSPVGNFWLEIARLVIEGMAMAGEKAYPGPPQGPIQ